ncbi:MAG TPA: ADP-ribosylation factor-like protein [Longimicrobiales bacterium]|nr:ADP-ribosylation factor-like protein [Longimicrobiales bacterium]
MPLVNYTTREITCKIVFYGPGRSGKTTNLQYIHGALPGDRKGEMVSLATETDRTLFFDFLPLDLGDISGFRTRLQLYTVPGQVYYNATRKLVLRGADGVVFVADSAPDRMDANVESLRNLQENLLDHGFDVRELPAVLQYNKRDLEGATPVAAMEETLNFRDVPSHESIATRGEGVFPTLRTISELVLRSVSQRFGATTGPEGSAP